MPRPVTEIWFGKEHEDPRVQPIPDEAARATVRGLFRPVLKLAVASLADIGVPLTGTKRIYFWQTWPSYPYLAEASTNRTSHMFLWLGELSGDIDLGRRGRVLQHELFHNERMELYTDNTLAEVAFTEGGANEAVDKAEFPIPAWFSEYIFGSIVERVAQLPRRTIANYRARFADDYMQDATHGPAAKYWTAEAPELPLQRLEIVGVAAASAILAAGGKVPDLLTIKPGVGLGYE